MEGLDSNAVLNFLEEAAKSGIELHSLIIVKNGKIVTEGWWYPSEANIRHGCYSVTKTFTAIAIGFTVEEGLISVLDKLADIFPEKLPKNPSENLLSMTIHDLLCMSGGQDYEANILNSTDWVESFMDVEVVNKPGTIFKYNSIGSHMLAEVIFKITGQTLLEYLSARLFIPIGIYDVRWDKTPSGNQIGGWGIHLKTEDLARIGMLFLQNGKWNNKQIISETWINKAKTKQIDTFESINGHDWMLGYCYQMWCSTPKDSYRLDGAFGQFSIVLPEQNVVIALTEMSTDPQETLNLIWKHIVSGMSLNILNNDVSDKKLSKVLSELSIQDNKKDVHSFMESIISRKTYTFEENECSLVPAFQRYMALESNIGLKSVYIVFDKDYCLFTWIEVNRKSTIEIGLDGYYRK